MRSYRIMVTVSPAMMVALEMLAEKTGLPVSTQAMVVLRQALDRTITSEEGLKRITARGAFSTAKEWHDGAVAYREVERAVEAVQRATEGV